MIRTDIIYFIFFQFTKNPLRTLLSISGIMIGIATLLMMTILSDGMQKQMLEKLTQSGGSNLIEVQPEYEYYGPPSGFDQKRVARLAKRIINAGSLKNPPLVMETEKGYMV